MYLKCGYLPIKRAHLRKIKTWLDSSSLLSGKVVLPKNRH